MQELLVLQALLFASSGMLSVGSITIVIILLMADQGVGNAVAYVSGYFMGYLTIALVAVSLGYRTGTSQSSANPIVQILTVLIGALLVYLGLRNWRKPRTGEESRIFRIVDGITPKRAFMIGSVVTVINFKNLTLFLTALSVIVVSDMNLGERLLLAVAVTFVFCVALTVPMIVYVVFPRRRMEVLRGIRDWLNRHSRGISIVAPIAFGVIFIVKGVVQL